MDRESLHNLLRSAARVPAVLAMLTYRRVRSAGCAPATTEFSAMDGMPSLATVLQGFPRMVALFACLLFFGGCMHTTKAEFTRHYDVGASTAAAENARHAVPRGQQILRISRIAVPQWLAGTAMYYRLGYGDDRTLAAYGRSDWIAPPAAMLEPVLRKAIAADGGWRAVVEPGNPATADASLHVRLDDFSQTFSQPNDSAGVIDASATLIDNHDDSVIAQRHFHVEVAASTPDAHGGAQALANASLQFASRLQQWLRQRKAGAGG